MQGGQVFRSPAHPIPAGHEAPRKTRGPEGSLRPPPTYMAPQTGVPVVGALLFLHFHFSFFFLVLGSGKSGKTYTDHTVDVLFREKERFHSYSEKTLVDVWLINHAHIYAFAGVGLDGIFPFSRRKFKLQTLTRPH